MRSEYEVTYYRPGIVFCETVIKKLNGDDPSEALAIMPEWADAFRIMERQIIEGTYEDGSPAEKSTIRQTGTFYPGGSIHTPQELRAMGHQISGDNIEFNGYAHGVITRHNRHYFFEPGDAVIANNPSEIGPAFGAELQAIGSSDMSTHQQ